jgi:Domain of unknown function (DUF4296)
MRIILIHTIAICFLLFVSCKPKQEEDETIPTNIISEEQFITILTEAYLGEGAAGINIKNVGGDKYDSTYVFNPLAENHVSKSQFDSATTYYAAHPKKLKMMYDKVLDRLSQLQTKGKIEK